MNCGEELHIGNWCAWCCRFVEDGDIDDSKCRAARERLAAKIESELRTPQPSQTAGWLFAIIVMLIAAYAIL